MDKTKLRQLAVSSLKELSSTEKKTIEQKIVNNVVHTNTWKNAHTIGITVSKGFEWDTSIIIEKAWEQNKKICVPKCYPKERKLVFYQLHSFRELEVVYYDLQEPKPIEENKIEKNALDMIVVPGLLFDTSGFRIGFGGGYYDRFLAEYNGKTTALTSSQLLTEHIPKESHDIAVQQIITEKDIINVKG